MAERDEDQTEQLNRLYRSGVRRGLYEAAALLANGGSYQDVLDWVHSEWGEHDGSSESES